MNLPHAYRLSIKWYSDQSICDTRENQVRVAPAQDATRLLSKLKPLLLGRRGSQPHRWHLCSDGRGIRRSFHFKNFNNTWVRANQLDHDYCNR